MSFNWKQRVAENFDARAEAYDRHSEVQDMVAQSLLSDLPAFEAPDVLEIGCGTGVLTSRLFQVYDSGRFHITDISPQMLRLARARARTSDQDKTRWSVMDGEHPILDRQYDLIASNMVFQWFEDLERSLDQLKSLLKPGGALLYSMPAPSSFPEWHAVLADLSLPTGTLDYKEPPGVYRREDIPLQYKNTFAFLRSMKQLGAHTPRAGYHPLSRSDLLKACSYADERFDGKMTWRILFGRLQA